MDYWIAIDRKKIGPLSLADVRSRHLSGDVLVWHNGLSTWRKASELPELAGSLAGDEPSAADEAQGGERESGPPAFVMPSLPQHGWISGVSSGAGAGAGSRGAAEVPPRPRSYLGWSIAAIILCCMPFAIVSLVYALKVSSRYRDGDYAGAQKASERAEIWLILSIVVGLVWMPFSIVLNMIGG